MSVFTSSERRSRSGPIYEQLTRLIMELSVDKMVNSEQLLYLVDAAQTRERDVELDNGASLKIND